MRLIFVRHGEPDYDHDCLTENGRRQAQSTAKRLRQEPIRKIFASPMGRTVETASYTAQMHGLEIETLDFMHEIDWGGLREADGSQRPLECEGHPWTLGCKLLTEHPEFIGSPDWAEHHYFRDNICTGYMDTISEGMDAFLTRFGLYRQDGLYECKAPCEDTIALFAHGGSGAVMFAHLLNLPLPFVLTSMPYGVCSVSVIAFEPVNGSKVLPRLELFNDMRHIDQVRTEALHFEK